MKITEIVVLIHSARSSQTLVVCKLLTRVRGPVHCDYRVILSCKFCRRPCERHSISNSKLGARWRVILLERGKNRVKSWRENPGDAAMRNVVAALCHDAELNVKSKLSWETLCRFIPFVIRTKVCIVCKNVVQVLRKIF